MNEQTTHSFQEIRDGWMKDPEFRKEYRAYSARMDLADKLTKWMRRIPVVGVLVQTFWFCVLGEGYRATLIPRYGAITFSFLNDGMKPTLWHTWRQVTHDHATDKYTAIYPGGAPKSLAQAQEWEEQFEQKRAAKEADEWAEYGLHATDDAVQLVGLDNDGNTVWTDGHETWNSGEPPTDDEKAELAARRDTAEIEANPELMGRILDTGNPEEYVDLPRPTNPAYDMECGD